MFVHLQSHSHYSFLEGVPSPQELVQAAALAGMPALALTDHRSLSGAVEFFDACRQKSIKPILGLEIEVEYPVLSTPLSRNLTDGKLVLLAENLTGWSNLCRLSSAAQNNPDTYLTDSLSYDVLAENSDGLICLTGGTDGMLASMLSHDLYESALAALQNLSEIFQDRLYVQLQRHSAEDKGLFYQLVRLSQQSGFQCAATHNIFYLDEDQSNIQLLLASIRLNKSISKLGHEDTAPQGACFLDEQDMQARFYHFPQALEVSLKIAERCNLELPVGITQFPEIELPSGVTPIQALKEQALSGARQRYKPLNEDILQRLNYELEVIETSGYTPLFLIMQDIVKFTREQGIPISSRGSAASSLVAHCLGITDPDPIRLNLYFERFLNPARATPPDIDTDLSSRRRDEVIQYVYKNYGSDHVAMVSTVNRFRPRSALRETAKAYGFSLNEVSKLADQLPYRWYGPPGRDHSPEDPYAQLSQRFSGQRYQRIFNDARKVIGLPHHLSIHPGGVVITPGPIHDIVPTQMTPKGLLVTQFDLGSIERLGLVKIDLLGIRGLSVLGDVSEELIKSTDRSYSSSLDLLESIPVEDPQTAETVRQGQTIGCFQIESPGMRATLKEVQARSVDDVMVALALYRPGPLSGGLKDAFVRRHRGLEPARYLHPSLEPLLEETYGVILYQEQVLRIAHELAGFSLSDADLLRRAMSHFDPGEQMITLKEKFLRGAGERFDVPRETADSIWEQMAAFAGYGFPKAHAASYAQVAWRSAWCKTHFPGLFMAAVLANWGGYYRQRVYLTEARRLGLTLLPPLVNYSDKEFIYRIIDGKSSLVMGLNQVRDLTRRTQSRIIRFRPFHNLQDFLSRVDPRPNEAANLIKAGALEGFETIPNMLEQIESGGWQKGQMPLFKTASNSGEDWSPARRSAAQEAILGTSISIHPLELFSTELAEAGTISIQQAAARIGEKVRLAGMRQTWRRGSTSKGGYIYVMSLEDLEGSIIVLVDAGIYRKYRAEFSGTGPYIIEGTVEMDTSRAEPVIRAFEIHNIR